LNSVSSLEYPTSFSGSHRVVKLSGEAYFEVAKNMDMPFKVVLPTGVEVQVLGTHFNVMAYEDEADIKTTLLEGSVKVSGAGAPADAVILSPNQQARLSKEGKISVTKDLDASQAIAWKNGTFSFDDTDLEVIMRQLARWYDVEISFENDVRSLQFFGMVSREENASAVLKLLEQTGKVDFEIEGKKIIVKSVEK
jgi:transmembrane sensor